MQLYAKLLAALLILPTHFSFAESPPVANITLSASEIIYEGEIDWGNFNKLVALYKAQDKKPKLLKINSKGGEVLSGVAFGNWIKEQKISVEVMDYCFSSCANYIFPAGKHKILNKHAVLYWHGGAFQKLKPGSEADAHASTTQVAQADAESYQTRFEKAERQFYRGLHIDGNLPTYGQSDSCWRRHRLDDYDGFFYSIADMKKMGLTNITVKGGQWQPKAQRVSTLNLFQAQPIKGKECQIDYELEKSILYGINSTQDIIDTVPQIVQDGLDKAMDKMDFFTLENLIYEANSERLVFVKKLTVDHPNSDSAFWQQERERIIAECKRGEGKGITKLENFILANSPLIETWHRYISSTGVAAELRLDKADCIKF